MYIPRRIEATLRNNLKQFPILSLTGPRQSGKTTLLKNAFPDYQYINLEQRDQREMLLSDPNGFLEDSGPQVIFDEAQNAPDVFSYIQVISDERDTPGQYILSGSQSFLFNHNISQSLAGRVSINHLMPFDISEIQEFYQQSLPERLYKGFYPRIYTHAVNPNSFYNTYLQTYIERDIRTLKNIGDLHVFSNFLGLCAGRTGQVLNLSALANDAGISVKTAKSWISLLEASYIIFLLEPYYRNFNKRLIKSPKLYFYDTGIIAALLRITNAGLLPSHYLYGAMFENLIISELLKYQIHQGKRPAVYYWRESNGTEIDCILEHQHNYITAIEIKGGRTFNKDYLKNLKKLEHYPTNLHIDKWLIHPGEHERHLSNIQIATYNNFHRHLPEIVNTTHD